MRGESVKAAPSCLALLFLTSADASIHSVVPAHAGIRDGPKSFPNLRRDVLSSTPSNAQRHGEGGAGTTGGRVGWEAC